MKVTFLTWEFPPHVYGGAGVHVKYLTKALSKMVEVEVRTLGVGGSEERGIKVMRYQPWGFLGRECDPKFRRLLEAFSMDLALVRDAIDSDIVHSHTWYTGLAGVYAKNLYDVNLVATVHSLEPKRPWKREAMGNAYRLSNWAERTCLKSCDKIIAVSGEDKKDIMESYGIEAERIEVIPNGIDIKKYRKEENPQVLERYGVRKPYVLFLGRLSRQKGIFDLVEASSRFPSEVKLVLVTGKADEGGIEEDLAREVERRKNIVWVNRMLGEEEVVAFYSSADVFVSPSTYEPFGIMNLEAMACGTPLVSTRVGGIKDVVVHGETGLLVNPGRPSEIVDSVNRILSDRKLAENLGKRGRRRVEEEFSWEKVAEKTCTLYRSLTG